MKDGEALPLDFKDLGSSDLYPQSVRHNANGRFVVVCGDGEYVVYTAMALRNKCFGSALEFVWSANDGNEYAIRENNTQVGQMVTVVADDDAGDDDDDDDDTDDDDDDDDDGIEYTRQSISSKG